MIAWTDSERDAALAKFWRARAERMLAQCGSLERTVDTCRNEKAGRALHIWRLAALDYLALAQKIERRLGIAR